MNYGRYSLKPLFISFSGGRTSGLMAKRLVERYRGRREIYCVFSNTGLEWEKTLIFVDACDKAFGLNVVWIEAVVNPEKGKGTGFKIVDFSTAARNGEPYEAVIAKYGICNLSYQHCTRELKTVAIKAYVRSLGFKHNTYEMAVGIRDDERKRVNLVEAAKHCVIYPLLDDGIDKTDVNMFWDLMPFKLDLKEHQGNCKWCFKKSDKKHALIYKESPEIYEFPAKMERLYQQEDKRVFFRQNRSTKQHIDFISVLNVEDLVERPDENSGCSESCEAFI